LDFSNANSDVPEGRLSGFVRRTEEALFGVLFVGMVIVCLPSGLTWGEPLSQRMVLWIALLGAGAATHERSYIAIDAVSLFLPKRGRVALRGATELLCVGVCGVLAWLSIVFLRDEMQYATGVAFLGIREWWLSVILPVGFALLTVRFLIAAVQDLRTGLRKPRAEEGE